MFLIHGYICIHFHIHIQMMYSQLNLHTKCSHLYLISPHPAAAVTPSWPRPSPASQHPVADPEITATTSFTQRGQRHGLRYGQHHGQRPPHQPAPAYASARHGVHGKSHLACVSFVFTLEFNNYIHTHIHIQVVIPFAFTLMLPCFDLWF